VNAHSGLPPPDFEIEKYFDDHKSAQVPAVFRLNMERLERKYGFPFSRQWAFEWRAVMDSTGSIYSDYPYHFVGTLLRSEVTGQFDLAQSDVYRSA
jgi:hypothetical protein